MKCIFTITRLNAHLSPSRSTASVSCRPFSASGCIAVTPGKRWSVDELKKLRDFSRKGFSASQIAQELPGRTVHAIRSRRLKDDEPKSKLPSKLWEAWEFELISRRRREGWSFPQIAEHHPVKRSCMAINHKWNIYPQRFDRELKLKHNICDRPYSEADIQNLVTMRMQEMKSFQEIAIQTNRSLVNLRKAWRLRARHRVPPELLEARRPDGDWTKEEDDKITTLRMEGMQIQQIATRMPGKTRNAVRSRLEAMQIYLKRRPQRAQIIKPEFAAIKKALEPVIDGKLSIGEVLKQFPQYKRRRFYDIKYYMARRLNKTPLSEVRKKALEGSGA